MGIKNVKFRTWIAYFTARPDSSHLIAFFFSNKAIDPSSVSLACSLFMASFLVPVCDLMLEKCNSPTRQPQEISEHGISLLLQHRQGTQNVRSRSKFYTEMSPYYVRTTWGITVFTTADLNPVPTSQIKRWTHTRPKCGMFWLAVRMGYNILGYSLLESTLNQFGQSSAYI